MRKIQDSVAIFFIIAVVILAIIAVLSIWDFLEGDIVSKSFSTIGVLALVAGVVIIAGRFLDKNNNEELGVDGMPLVNPVFSMIRHMTLYVLMVSAALLGLFGILSIWEVLSKEVLYKAISSIATTGFAAFVVVATSLLREKKKVFEHKPTGGQILFWIIVAIFVVPALIGLF